MSSEQRKQKAFLEMMTTEQLEELLRRDAKAENSQLSGDDILEIMEVIERKKNDTDEPQTDVDAAWQDFKENYLGNAALYVPDMDEETESRPAESSQIKPQKKKKHILRTVLIAAVLIVALCTTAIGKNLFRTLADWTRETFMFRTTEETEGTTGVFLALQAELAGQSELPLVPKWAPEGTVEINGMTRKEFPNKVRYVANYQTPNGEYCVIVILYDTKPEEYTYLYEKNSIAVKEEYIVNGVVHQIVCNNQTNNAVWACDTAECLIQGDLSVDELKRMVDSIYE